MQQLKKDRPTVPEVLPMVREIYAMPGGGAGHCLHVVLDDNNVGDDSVRYALEEAVRAQCSRCVQVATLLLQMTKTQRLKLAWGATTPPVQKDG